MTFAASTILLGQAPTKKVVAANEFVCGTNRVKSTTEQVVNT
jgi:hypothetical protein